MSGMLISDISKKYKVSNVSINNWRKFMGISRARKRPDLSAINIKTKKYIGEDNPAYGHRKMSWLNKSILKKLYKMYGSYIGVAKALDISPNTVKKMMIENKVMLIKYGRKCSISKELLENIYKKSGSINGVSKKIGLSEDSIAIRMRKYGIPYANNREWKRQAHFWKPGQREKIRIRDDYKCFCCGNLQTKEKYPVHHIFYDTKFDEDRCLITLCKICHGKTNGNKTFWVDYFVKRMSEAYKYDYKDVQFMIEGGEVLLVVNNVIARK